MVFTAMMCCMFLICGALLPVLIYRMYRDPGYIVPVIFITPVLYVLTVALFLSVPRGYVIEPERIIIKRLLSNVVIEFSDIKGVGETDAFMWQGKNGWNPGVFGYVGTYRSESFGRFSAYLTNWKYLVTIQRHDARPIVISPGSPTQFVWKCNSIIDTRTRRYEQETKPAER